jgi:flagellar basal body-associated protein FliL
MTGLRQAITSSLDQVLGSGSAVQAVYFTQFIVQ